MRKRIIIIFFIIFYTIQIYGFASMTEPGNSTDAVMVIAIETGNNNPAVKSITLVKGDRYNREFFCRASSEPLIPGENRAPLLMMSSLSGEILYRTAFNYLTARTVPPSLSGSGDSSPDVIAFENPEVYLVVPYFSEAAFIEIYNPGEATASLVKEILPAGIQIYDSAENGNFSIPGLPPAQEGKLHFLVIASGYDSTNIDTFAAKASELKNYLLSIEPFQTYGSEIEVHIYENMADLGCYHNCNNIQRLMCCNSGKVTAAAAASGYPFDEIIVLHNIDVYSGGGYREYSDTYKTNSYSSYAMSYHGLSFKKVILHELGHSFGNLCDEYTYSSEGYSYSSCVNCRENCSIWDSISQNCQPGCAAKSDYYRPEDSVMLTLSIEHFNAVSLYATYLPDGLQERILYFLGQSIPISVLIDGQRKEERAWLIRKQYGEITINLKNLEEIDSHGNPLVSKVLIYRTSPLGGYEFKAEIPIDDFQDLRYVYFDKYLDRDTAYTYRVDALDSYGNVIQISNEVTI